MRASALLPALLITASASAQTNSAVNITLSSTSGGAATLVGYSFTGEWVSEAGQTLPLSVNQYSWFSNFDAIIARTRTSESLVNPQVAATTASINTSWSVNLPSITATNLTTNGTANISSFMLGGGANGYLAFGFAAFSFPLSNQWKNGRTTGDTFRLGGDTTGSFVIDQNFSIFNEGSWSWAEAVSNTNGALFYTSNVTIGSVPVPEPSTYGLALGGLALVGAAIRRRNKPKA
jgi:hypothetical protein